MVGKDIEKKVKQVLGKVAAEDEDQSIVEDADAEAHIEDIDAPKARRHNFNSEFDVDIVKDDWDGMEGRFINLIDLIPPLPKKGDFEVSTIKNSQYFFS